ncbi:hypothetical protein [Rhizobacter sp. LjRoot28]|uniref:hypothetical protein n=1 Tax=Rhizobacter sp. LjRoot28 TaxID=3342309 RepID=UPI003ED08CA5
MKVSDFSKAALALTCAVILAACGGGSDDESGSLSDFSVAPDSSTLTAATGTPEGVCPPTNSSVEIFVFGGTAPYQVANSYPQYLEVSKTVVGKGESFTVRYLGGCLKPGVITVVDKFQRTATVEIGYEPASATATP